MGLFDRLKSNRDDGRGARVPESISPSPDNSATAVDAADDDPLAAPDVDEQNSEVPYASEPPAPAPFIDFESEFAAPELDADVIETPLEPSPPIAEPEEAELEEWSEPLPSAAPSVLAVGTTLESPEGTLKIEAWLESRGGENVYRALLVSEGDTPEETSVVRLREATGVWGERLSREAMWRLHWDATGRIAMLPRLIGGFTNGEISYLATEMPAEGSTLAQFFVTEEGSAALARSERETAAFLAELLLVVTQIAAFLVRLHGAGFAHLGLRPDVIVPAKPVQILDCSFATPLGEPLEAPLSFAGYSAPELSHPAVVDARSDLYAVGALLYRAVTGADVPESGADFTTWQPRVIMAGVPQILRRTLGEMSTRYNSAEEVHRALVRLKNRLRPTISHAAYGLSTIGLESSRATNQDAFGFQCGAWETEQGPVAWTAFCVADGMGGMAAGEVASEVAVAAFLRGAAQWSAQQATQAAPVSAATQALLVKEWATLANEAVVKAMEVRHARGGCTLDAGLVIDRRLCTAHVGDARLYLLRGGEFQLLSRDHSFVMSLLLQGQITFDEIRTHKERNKITRSLGERHPQPEYFIDGLLVQTSEPALELQPGDVLLACSDGVWEPVLESEMLCAVSEGDLPQAARAMLRLALQRGAPDNATLVLFRLDEHPAPVFA